MDVLPEDCLRILFKYFSYDEVSKLRLVCTRFNNLSGQILNEGFKKVRNFRARCVKEVKDSLPRRESERRQHHLFPRHEVLQAIETRLSLLSMTYNRMMYEGKICFIPGKVLDELFKILYIVHNYSVPVTSAAPMLQELRDISSMAMEHFDEHIYPEYEAKEKTSSNSDFIPFLTAGTYFPNPSLNPPAPPTKSSQSIGQSYHRVMSKYHERMLHEKICTQGKVITQLRAKTRHLENVTTSLSLTVSEQKGHISEVVRQLTALQALLGVRSPAFPPPMEINAGSSGDLNNNSSVKSVAVGDKRTSTSEETPSCSSSKRMRHRNKHAS